MDDKADSPDAPPMFSGTPRKYRRIAWLLAISTHAFLYGGLLLIEYVWRGRDWLLGAKPIVFTVFSMLLFARLCHRSLMYVDTQYGRGSRWRLVAHHVKLPEEIGRAWCRERVCQYV